MKRVSELTGAELDYAVAKCLGVTGKKVMRSTLVGNGRGHKQEWYEMDYPAYSTLWAEGGPIIERERIIWRWVNDVCEAACPAGDKFAYGMAPAPLIAAMRAFVASRLGDEIEIPEKG